MNAENFKRNIYRRIQLAAAVFVVRSTPSDKSPGAFANELQQRLKLHWLNSPITHDASTLKITSDQCILAQQQDIVRKRLCSIIPESSALHSKHVCASKSGANTNECFESEGRVEGFSPVNCENIGNKIQANALFIQAVIQVKALAQAHLTVPVERYVDSVSRLYSRRIPEGTRGKSKPYPSMSSEDSGYDAIEDNSLDMVRISPAESLTPMTGVASSMLLYIINSCNGDQLLIRSIHAILTQLKILACAAGENVSAWSLNEAINGWKGSLYDQSMEAVRCIIDMHGVQSDKTDSGVHLCLAFVQEMIATIGTDVLSKDDSSQKESQIILTLKLCEGTSLYLATVDHLLHKVENLMISIRSKVVSVGQAAMDSEYLHNFTVMHDFLHDVENCFFTIRLVEIFLEGLQNHITLLWNNSRDLNSHKLEAQNKIRNIAGLWRKHYNVQNENPAKASDVSDKMRKVKSDIRHWKQLMDNLAAQALNEHPLLAVVFYECVHLIPIVNW